MRRAFFSALALLLGGCAGYHIGASKPKMMEGVTTLGVDDFKNDTLEPRIEVLAADTLIKQFQQDGTYRIESPNRADAVLEGTITAIKRSPARSVRGNVIATKEFALQIEVHFAVKRRTDGKELLDRSINGHTTFFVSGDVNQDERQAIPLALQDAAVNIVSQTSEGW